MRFSQDVQDYSRECMQFVSFLPKLQEALSDTTWDRDAAQGPQGGHCGAMLASNPKPPAIFKGCRKQFSHIVQLFGGSGASNYHTSKPQRLPETEASQGRAVGIGKAAPYYSVR